MNRPDGPAFQSERTAMAILIPFVAAVALIVVGSLWPQSRLWGFGWYQFFPWYVGAIVLLVAVALVVGWWYRGAGTRPKARSRTSTAADVVVSLILCACFIFLFTRTHFLGDGYILLGRLEAGAYSFQPWEFVPFTLERWVYEAFSPLKGQIFAFRLISWLSGVGFMVAVWWAAFRLFQDAIRRRLFAFGLFTGGYLLLFFGYVEHYPLFVTVVAIFTLTGILVARGRYNRLWLLPSLSLGLVLHPFGVVLILPAAYLLFRNSALQRVYDGLSQPVRIAVPATVTLLAAALFVYFYVTNLFFRLAFVPPWADRFTVEGYTLFSWHHLVDVFSLMLQLVPGLLIFIALIVTLPLRDLTNRPEYRFLALLSLLSMAIVFIFDPKIGLPRDWDLFAFAGVPLTVLAFYALLDFQQPVSVGRLAPVAMIILSVVILAPRVATQVSEEKSIDVFQYYADLDPIRNKDGQARLIQYYRAGGRNDLADALSKRIQASHPELRLHERGMALTRVGELDSAIDIYKRVLTIDPSMATTWSNIGLCYLVQSRFDSAITYLEAADGIQPYNAITIHLLGKAYFGAGRRAEAERCWREAIRLNPDNFESYQLLLSLYRQQDRGDDYRRVLMRAATVKGAPDDLVREARDSAASER